MSPTTRVHPEVARRIAAIVSGPHACPDCAGPTWTTPPTPWPSMRPFVTECSMCRRPLHVRVRPDLVVRGVAVDDAPDLDPVTSLLDTPGTRPFRRRLAVAALLPVAAFVVLAVLASWTTALLVGALLVLPSAMFGPSIAAIGAAGIRRSLLGAPRPQRRAIEITRVPWRQLDRERFDHCREQLDALAVDDAEDVLVSSPPSLAERRTRVRHEGDVDLDLVFDADHPHSDLGSGHAAAG